MRGKGTFLGHMLDPRDIHDDLGWNGPYRRGGWRVALWSLCIILVFCLPCAFYTPSHVASSHDVKKKKKKKLQQPDTARLSSTALLVPHFIRGPHSASKTVHPDDDLPVRALPFIFGFSFFLGGGDLFTGTNNVNVSLFVSISASQATKAGSIGRRQEFPSSGIFSVISLPQRPVDVRAPPVCSTLLISHHEVPKISHIGRSPR